MPAMKLDRRTLLRGMIGGALVHIGLPPLDIFMNNNGTAYAAGSPFPRRFGLFFWGNGVLPVRWQPSTEGASDAWQLSEQLQPLAAVKKYVTVVSDLEVKIPNAAPHGAGAAGILSGSPLILEGEHQTFATPTIDQIIASDVGKYTRFPSLEFGVEPRDGWSHNGPDNMNPPEASPQALFERIFGGSFRLPGDSSEPDPSLGLRRSVLDAVMADAKALQNKLGANDQARLDQHLTGLRELEKRVAFLEDNPVTLDACAIPGAPEADYPDIDGRPQLTEKNRVLSDIITMALACDQTRVFSHYFSSSVNNILFSGVSAGHHSLTHDEPGEQPEVNAIVIQIMTEYARLLGTLASIREGEGTLLDNCVVFGTSDCGFGRTHSMDRFPFIYGGSAGGRLNTDFHYKSPSKENASMALLSLVRAVSDLPPASFGTEDGESSASLGAIEA